MLSVQPQAVGLEPVQSCTGQSLGFPSAGKHCPGTISDFYPFDVTVFECGLVHKAACPLFGQFRDDPQIAPHVFSLFPTKLDVCVWAIYMSVYI